MEGVNFKGCVFPPLWSAGMVDTYHLDLLHAAGKLLHSWTINNASLVHAVLVGEAEGVEGGQAGSGSEWVGRSRGSHCVSGLSGGGSVSYAPPPH